MAELAQVGTTSEAAKPVEIRRERHAGNYDGPRRIRSPT
jgi:hypothetical protein